MDVSNGYSTSGVAAPDPDPGVKIAKKYLLNI
jgi:hypothetical protein